MRTGDPGITRKVIVGEVVKPVGLKGELRIRPITDNPERFSEGGTVRADAKDGGEHALVIRHVSPEPKGTLRVVFEGVGSVDEAEALRGRTLYVHESDVPPLPEGEYYYFQIIGLSVYTYSGKLLGKVTDIFTAGEKDVYEVKGGGKEYLIPVTDDAVDVIDVPGGRIVLKRMEGYIPEDEV